MGIRIASDTRPVQVSGASIEGHPRCRLARDELIPGSRYVLKRWVGEGGMGVIYEAEHVDVRRPVAVKILRPEYATNFDVLDAFRFEARATSAIDSPFLVKIFDFFELPDGRSALVMELLRGRDLSRREDIVMAPGRVVGIARQVCKALQTVHDEGLVHRDLKPENIFICEDGERADAVRVLDFGIARLTVQATAAQSGGTPLYTPPEVILGGAQGSVADVYALGCVLYELLTGVPAFGREDVDRTLKAHLDERPLRPSEVVETIPRQLDAVVMRAIEREPQHRFPTMAAFEAALCEAQVEAGFSTPWDDLAFPEGLASELRQRLRALAPGRARRRRSGRFWVWGSVALSVALSGAAIVAMMRANVEETPALTAAEREAYALAREARMAGSRAEWVYPSTGDVSSRTAYQAVLALEEMGEVGIPLAAALRDDFSATLTRLGDEYWDAVGGTRFAVAYYEQALLFDPDAARPRERTELEPDTLESFAARAANGRFALDELVRVEPLVVLAAQDGSSPQERMTRVRRRKRKATPPPAPVEAVAEAPADDAVDVEPESEPTFMPTTDPDARSDVRSSRNPGAASSLVAEAKSAVRSGNDGKAKLLFERALAKDNRNVAAHAGLRDLAFDAGDYARAVRHGRRAVRLAPRNATHQLRLGDAYYRTHDYTEAERAYAAAAKRGDDRAKWRLEKARQKRGG